VHDRAEIRQIKEADSVQAAVLKIQSAVSACDVGIVLKVNNFEDADFVQRVEDHALAYPEYVMEKPEVTVNIYPDSGNVRVVEVKFTYKTSRDTLKEMQTKVKHQRTMVSQQIKQMANQHLKEMLQKAKIMDLKIQLLKSNLNHVLVIFHLIKMKS
jgi:hypothetical protein